MGNLAKKAWNIAGSGSPTGICLNLGSPRQTEPAEELVIYAYSYFIAFLYIL
ncbi:MAG: hypothetical protein KME17_12825 [Cyanosarcina radialis HA8281-LM2]|jgi:hypothetical protein|nr:hypothetical protein [Cyanosarcina radialis HA8281-LM2]